MSRHETKSLPISKEMVYQAYRQVKQKRGGAGIDGQDWTSFESKLGDNLYKIWNRLSSGSYFPPPIKRVTIPKSNGGERHLGVPTIGDRIAQQVVKSYLEPRLEREFMGNSYGYRPLKSAHAAVGAVRAHTKRYAWVVDLDIQGFFDNMSHELLMKALDRHVAEKWVKMYIERWLKAPMTGTGNGDLETRQRGTAQGGVISPLLSNLFLHYTLDKWLEKRYAHLSFVRYADDIVIHCRSKEEAETVLEAVGERLATCELSLHETKSKIVHCRDYRRLESDYTVKFDFLGFSFQPRPTRKPRGKAWLSYDCAISTRSKQKIRRKLREMGLHRRSDLDLETLTKWLNPRLRAWMNYYGYYRKWAMADVFRDLHFRLAKWVRRRYKMQSIRAAYGWLKRAKRKAPRLFYHWTKGFGI